MSDNKQEYRDPEFKSPITVKEEEIDLGKLFSLFGKALAKLFSSIEKLLKFIFHYLILLLIFLKKNLVKLLIVSALGLLLGGTIDTLSKDKYTYDMIIEPNYGSVDQILEKIEYYNVLIKEEDTLRLSKEFGVSFEEAKGFVSFELVTHETEKDQLLAYDKFIKETDTLTHMQFSFDDFIGEGTSKYDSRFYVYRIKSTIINLKNLESKIISDIETSPTLHKRKRIKMNTIKLDSLATRQELQEIDSLRLLYKRVTLAEVENQKKSPNTSTYIDFSKETRENKDIELFTISRNLHDNLIALEKEKETSEEIVNVITTFNSVGNNRATFIHSKAYLFGRIFLFIVLGLTLLKGLNKYLLQYQK